MAQAAQADPWVEAAKGYKPQSGGAPAPAPANGNDDWKLWQQSGTQEDHPSMAGNFQKAFDELTAPEPYGTRPGIGGELTTAASNFGSGVLGLATPLFHPKKFAESIQPQNMAERLGGPAAVIADRALAPFAKNPDEGWGDYAKRAGAQATQMAPQLLAPELGRDAAGEVSRVTDPLREYRSALIPHNEAVARAATDIIRPNPLEARNVQRTLTQRMPDLKQFFDQSGTKIDSPLVFAKGAENVGKGATDYYKSNFIDPLSDAPAGSGTVGSVYGDLGKINDQLRPIYRARSTGEQLSKEATDHMAALEQQRDLLNGVLYKTISERTGLPIEQIQDINQRGAQMQSLGDVTDAAQRSRRAGFSGYTPTGLPVPMGMADHALRMMQYLRGGPEAVAGRKLGRVLSMSEGEPSTLPNADEVASNRQNYQAQEQDAASANQMASQARKPEGMTPTPPQTEPLTPDIEGAQKQMREIQPRRAAQAAQGLAAERADSLTKYLRDRQLLGRSRELQERAKIYRNH